MNGKVAKEACIHDTKADRIIGNKNLQLILQTLILHPIFKEMITTIEMKLYVYYILLIIVSL